MGAVPRIEAEAARITATTAHFCALQVIRLDFLNVTKGRLRVRIIFAIP
jgi:hypothetical protein